ncbi:MAG: amidase family protein, partial [Alphaproteobacteria bacterium]
LDRLADAGAVLEPVDEPELEQVDARMGYAIVLCEAARWWHHFAADRLGMSLMDLAEEIASRDVRDLFERLEALSIGLRPDCQAAMAHGRPALQARCASIFAERSLDALLTATVPVQPPFVGEDDDLVADGVALPTFPTLTEACALAAVAGLPSLSIPAGLDAGGLPVGLLLDGPAGGDRRLLAVGAAVERVVGMR